MIEGTVSCDGADPFTQDMFASMDRLGTRPYSEVGVPMFLVAVNENGESILAQEGQSAWLDRLVLFNRMAKAFQDAKPAYTDADIARLIEVFADQCLLQNSTTAFSALHEAAELS